MRLPNGCATALVGVAALLWSGLAATTGADASAVGDHDPGGLSGRQHIDGVFDVLSAEYGDEAKRAVALARAGTAWQAAAVGVAVEDPPAPPAYERPSEALLALAQQYGGVAGSQEALAVRGLDGLPAAPRAALLRVVEAYLAFDESVETAWMQADRGALVGLQQAAEAGDLADGRLAWQGLTEAGVDVAPVLAARLELLEAALKLSDAMQAAPLGSGAATVNLCPAFALDLTGVDNVYETDCALIVDVGGDDTFRNNAGGAPWASEVGSASAPSATAAVTNLSGNDDYGGDLARRGPVNGGAGGGFPLLLSAGFLFDADGHDELVGGRYGVNGGGNFGGLGFLVSGGGDDRVAADFGGVNGGGHLLGAGMLISGGGNNRYEANSAGANGGGLAGTGLLLDAAGDDAYTGGGNGLNGGALGGAGLLVDGNGNDTYVAEAGGVNGGAATGHGLLLDLEGTDTYRDHEQPVRIGTHAVRQIEHSCNGTGTDRTMVPKCTVGAQVDSDDPTGIASPTPN